MGERNLMTGLPFQQTIPAGNVQFRLDHPTSAVILARLISRELDHHGILDLFRRNKDEIHGARVLVCALDDRFADLVREDSEIYGRYYRPTTLIILPSIQALLARTEQQYDIVHLMCDVYREWHHKRQRWRQDLRDGAYSTLLRSKRKITVVHP